MILAVTVTNELGDQLRIPLSQQGAIDTGIGISKIEGIGAGSADIYTQETASSDGSNFTSARATERNIVIEAYLLPQKTIEESRHRTYKYFPKKKKVTLRFETESRVCDIDGYVESNEPDIFSERESTQISIICPYPYFSSAGSDKETLTVFYGIEPTFEFIFSNESLTDPLIQFGAIQNKTENNIFYGGDADVGIMMHIRAMGTAKNITLYNIETRESMTIDTDKLESMTGSPLSAGDEIIVSTIKNDKYVQLLREGVYTNILNCLDRDSDWLELTPGDNLFAYTAESGAENLQFWVTNKTLFEGV